MDNLMQQKIEELLLKDKGISQGHDEVKEDAKLADELAQAITLNVIDKIVNSDGKFEIKHGLLALARSLTYFGQYLYDDKEEYGKDIVKAREIVADRLIVALENPKPCGKCEACNSGNRCTEPLFEIENTKTKFIPLVASAMLEYDHWCKTLYKNINKTFVATLPVLLIGLATIASKIDNLIDTVC